MSFLKIDYLKFVIPDILGTKNKHPNGNAKCLIENRL